MKTNLLCIVLTLIKQFCFAQPVFDLNQGGAKQTNYHSVIPYEKNDGKLIVTTVLNGKKYRFLLDTGAPTSISENLYNELRPAIVGKGTLADSGNKLDSVLIVSLEELVIGNINFANIPAFVIKYPEVVNCYQIDGSIGSNLMRNSIVQFNDGNKTVIFTDDRKNLMLNDKHASELIVDTLQSNPFFYVTLKDKNAGRTNYLFDTGGYDFSLTLEAYAFFEKLNIFKVLGKAKGSYVVGLFGAEDERIHYKLLLPAMEFNGIKLLNVLIKTDNFAYSTAGTKLLELGIVTVDYKNKKFYFDPNFKKKKDLFEKSPPIHFMLRNNQLQIGIVWDNALNDSIKAGDQVISVDEINLENMGICELMTLSRTFGEKDKMSLSVKRQTGMIQKIVLERKDYR